ncbi:MAG: ATP synthase F0 subunit B [Nannocystaceae bacterium]
MDIDLKTVAFELLNFVVLMVIFARFLFKPVREVMRRRREEIERARHEVERAKSEAEAAQAGFDARRRELEASAEAATAAARSKGEAAADALLREARAEAERLHRTAEEEVAHAERRAIAALTPRLTRLAADAAGRLLADADAPELCERFALKAAAELRGNLERASADAGAPSRAQAPTIEAWLSADADEARTLACLRRGLGEWSRAGVEVRRDPELVAGVRLVAGGLEIEASASATLERWLARSHDGREDEAA